VGRTEQGCRGYDYQCCAARAAAVLAAMMDTDHTTFAAEVQTAGDTLSPARAGLLFAREVAYPDLHPSDYVIQIEDLAAQAGPRVAAAEGVHDRALALARYLFDEQGFQGNSLDYGDPRNSYLNEVLERRLGIPISLSVLYVEIGRRLRLPVVGVGLPGHFIVRAGEAGDPLYLDPFHGGRPLSLDDCRELVAQSTGVTAAFDPDWLLPTPPRDIVARMLNNLRGFYLSVEDWLLAAAVLERLHALQPQVDDHLRDLGVLHYRAGRFRKATELLNEYLVRAPNAPDVDAVRQGRDLLLQELGRLN
jgi:regulator of sirC expression with transglutaminase-like and TPR domain